MKRTILSVALLLAAALLCACAPTENVAVADISFTEGAVYASAEEPFFEEGKYWYVFPSIMSHDCTVTYTDGSRENIVDALTAGHVTVEDMDAYGLPYRTLPLPSEVVDIVLEIGEDTCLNAAVDVFYEDGEYRYFFGHGISHYYIVHYQSGATETMPCALEAGRITPADLVRFDVPCSKEKILPAPYVVGITERPSDTPREAAVDVFYRTDRFYYYFTEKKSEDVQLLYSDGERVSLVWALESGRITVEDLDAYGVDYYIGLRAVVDIEERYTSGAGRAPSRRWPFYMDDRQVYYYPDGEDGKNVVVLYNDGSEGSLAHAFAQGHLTVSALEAYGIPVCTEQLVRLGIAWNESFPPRGNNIELLCVDGEARYAIDYTGLWKTVRVSYAWGASESLSSALTGGRITLDEALAALERLGASCQAVSK